jgi:hypothetical protein
MPREIVSDEVGQLPRHEHNSDSNDYQVGHRSLAQPQVACAIHAEGARRLAFD